MGRARAGRRLGGTARRCLCLLCGLLVGGPAHAQSHDIAGSDDPVCEQAGRIAERAHALPDGLLLAIGRVESGRWDAARGRTVPWPWTIDANGDGRRYDSKAQAVAAAASLRAAGTPYVDVGCFQIDLTYHPDAFPDLDQAFDPYANADYAGRFLADLHMRAGTWDDAVAAYHSLQPDRGTAYRQRVFAVWPVHEAPLPALPASGPLVVRFASGASMRVWTPGLAVDAADSAGLPRVIVGVPHAH